MWRPPEPSKPLEEPLEGLLEVDALGVLASHSLELWSKLVMHSQDFASKQFRYC